VLIFFVVMYTINQRPHKVVLVITGVIPMVVLNSMINKIAVAESERDNAIPHVLQRYLLPIEAHSQNYLRQVSGDYTGGQWNFYKLSNGGFFMAPSDRQMYTITVPDNYFHKTVDAEAAGLIAFLSGINRVLAQQAGSVSGPDADLHRMYYLIMEYAVSHTKFKREIALAID